MMLHTIRRSLLSMALATLILGCAAGCMPELTNGNGNGKDTTETELPGKDTFIPDITGVCKDASLPSCKTMGVCNEQGDSGLPVVWKCNEDTVQWECDYSVLGELYQKKETLCDGLDNDCDGDKDEVDHVDFADACPDIDHGACAAAVGDVEIVCVGAGNPKVYAYQCDATAVPGYAEQEFFDPQSESSGQLCDNLDNDCDGDTDEDHEHFGELTATESEELKFSLCQGFSDICYSAVSNNDPYHVIGDVYFRCNQGGMECSYNHVALFDAPESICDGVDNDCDGETDEVTDITESDCPHQGVCEGKVSGICINGQWLCDMTEALVDPDYQIEEGRCDGLDNDCDGDVDEGLDWESLVIARCAESCDTLFCETWNPACPDALTPSPDKDDRCPYGHPGGEEGYLGNPYVPYLDTAGMPILPGVCAYDPLTKETDVVLHCLPHDGNNDGTPENAYWVCLYDALSQGESPVYTGDESEIDLQGHWCDNLDNDCDGLVDAHYVSPSLTYEIEVTDGNPQDLIWTTCKALGECALAATAKCNAGVWKCNYGAGLIEEGAGDNCFNAQEEPTPDNPACKWVETLCDGKDNDCDGDVDEGISSVDGDALTAAGCTQEGVCSGSIQAVCNDGGENPGAWSCDYSDAFALGYAVLEDGEPTLCDALDNDCDGVTDEEISAGPLDPDYLLIIDEAGCLDQGICDGAVDATCNKLLEAPGVWTCAYPDGFFADSVLVGDVYHENWCDGLDNDCDGVTDENLDQDFGGAESPKFRSSCPIDGICTDTMQWGCALGEWTCDGDPAVGWEADEITCDDVDNDCDGVTDEDLGETGPDGADCYGYGEGVCQVGLAATCAGGIWSCIYDGVQAWESVEVSCDGLDNDCDGVTDEELNWTTSPGNNPCMSQGVCDPQEVIAVCTETPSGWLCNYDAIADYTAVESMGFCDGLDNDCDGDTDEQACASCAPCTEDAHCYNNFCRSDPFDGEKYCAWGSESCVMENLGTGDCEIVNHGQTACVTLSTRAICTYGTWNVDSVEDCTEDTPVCYFGLCKFCVPGALSCDGTTVLQCNDQGTAAYPVDSCGPGQICVGAGDCITNSEFQVDQLAAAAQFFDPKPRVVRLKGGGFVAVWGSAHPTADGSGTAIMAHIFGDDLNPAGEPFLVNEVVDDDQSEPSVDASAVGLGRFVVAWSTTDKAGDPGQGIAARVFESDGTPVSGEIHVNQVTDLDQSNPAVTMDEDGRFLVAWDTKLAGIENPFDVKARYFHADGTPDGDEFTLNTSLLNTQRTPDADFLSDGGLVAGLASAGKDSQGFAVVALTLDAAGAVDLDETLVNEYEFGSQKNQAVTALEEGIKAGWFAIVWESTTQASGDSSGVFLELLNQVGVQVGQGTDIQVHQNDDGAQGMPRMARLSGDRLVIVWESDDADADGVGIARRIFNSSGGAETSEGLVNQSITGDQFDPDASSIDPTTFVVVWTNAYTGHVMGRILND